MGGWAMKPTYLYAGMDDELNDDLDDCFLDDLEDERDVWLGDDIFEYCLRKPDDAEYFLH
jgi:hypothetical protein